jgi:hypothetical protein
LQEEERHRREIDREQRRREREHAQLEVEAKQRAWLEAGRPEVRFNEVSEAQHAVGHCKSQLQLKRRKLRRATVAINYLRIAQSVRNAALRVGLGEPLLTCLAGGTAAFGFGAAVGLLLFRSPIPVLALAATAFGLGAVATAILMCCPSRARLPHRLTDVQVMRERLLAEEAEATANHNSATLHLAQLLHLDRLNMDYVRAIEEERRLKGGS